MKKGDQYLCVFLLNRSSLKNYISKNRSLYFHYLVKPLEIKEEPT